MTDDLHGDQGPDEGDEAIEELRGDLAEVLAGFAEEHDVDPEFLAMLLLDAAIGQRAVAYVMETAKPSESGLKLELDRLNRAFSEMVRDARKQSGSTLNGLVEALALVKTEDWQDDE